jgi:hypothetical protein
MTLENNSYKVFAYASKVRRFVIWLRNSVNKKRGPTLLPTLGNCDCKLSSN